MFSFSPGKREQRRCRLESTLLLSLPAFLLWGAGLSAFLPVFLGLAAIVGGWLFPFFLALFTFRVENAELSWQKGLFFVRCGRLDLSQVCALSFFQTPLQKKWELGLFCLHTPTQTVRLPFVPLSCVQALRALCPEK